MQRRPVLAGCACRGYAPMVVDRAPQARRGMQLHTSVATRRGGRRDAAPGRGPAPQREPERVTVRQGWRVPERNSLFGSPGGLAAALAVAFFSNRMKTPTRRPGPRGDRPVREMGGRAFAPLAGLRSRPRRLTRRALLAACPHAWRGVGRERETVVSLLKG